jgi:hypothetical protein
MKVSLIYWTSTIGCFLLSLVVQFNPRWQPSPESYGRIFHFVGKDAQMSWQLVLTILAGWTVVPALAWVLAREILRFAQKTGVIRAVH